MQTTKQTFEYPLIYTGRTKRLESFNKDRMIEICFNVFELVGDILFGAIVGSISGWISGWCIASVYRNLYEPIHFISFEVVNKWYYLPYEYGRQGMIIGAAAGVLFISAMTVRKMARVVEQETDQIQTSRLHYPWCGADREEDQSIKSIKPIDSDRQAVILRQ